MPASSVRRTMCVIEGDMDLRCGMFLTPNLRPQIKLCRDTTMKLRCLPAAVAAIKALALMAPDESIDVEVCSLLAAFATQDFPDWKEAAGADCVKQVVEALRRAVSRRDIRAMHAWVDLLGTLVGLGALLGDDRTVRQMVQEGCVPVLLLVLGALDPLDDDKVCTPLVPGHLQYCAYMQCSICKLLDLMIIAGHAEAVLDAGGVEALSGLLKTSPKNDVRYKAAVALKSLAKRDTKERMYMQARGGMQELSGAFLAPELECYVFEQLCSTLLILAKMPAYQALLQQDAALLDALKKRLLDWDARSGYLYPDTQCNQLIAVCACVVTPARRSLRIKRKRD